MKIIKVNQDTTIYVYGVEFHGIEEIKKHAQSREPKDGVYVLQDRERYPCFDSSDYLYENRYFCNFVFARRKEDAALKMHHLKKVGHFSNYQRLHDGTPNYVLPLIYFGGDTNHPMVIGGCEDVCFSRDKVKEYPSIEPTPATPEFDGGTNHPTVIGGCEDVCISSDEVKEYPSIEPTPATPEDTLELPIDYPRTIKGNGIDGDLTIYVGETVVYEGRRHVSVGVFYNVTCDDAFFHLDEQCRYEQPWKMAMKMDGADGAEMKFTLTALKEGDTTIVEHSGYRSSCGEKKIQVHIKNNQQT